MYIICVMFVHRGVGALQIPIIIIMGQYDIGL